MPGRDWLDGIFRLHDSYEVVPFERLPVEHQESLTGIHADPEFFGLLRRKDGRHVHAIGRDAALLLFALQQAGPLPAFARRRAEQDGPRHLLAWVADRILEVQLDGGFVSGPEAVDALDPDRQEGRGDGDLPVTNQIQRLSLEALRYAERLPRMDPARLTARLYFFHRVPLGPSWRRRFPDRHAIDRWLQLGPGQEVERALRGFNRHNTAEDEGEGWWSFSRPLEATASLSQRRYKLYVSPACEALPAALRALGAALPDLSCHSFKYPTDLAGWLRPDKLVLYFHDFEALAASAERLEQVLEGIPAHGVPFTASRNTSGLLSWGVDPDPGIVPELRTSWRLFVAQRLAHALLLAHEQRETGPAWRAALQRVRLDGIDPERWTPSPSLFRSPEN